MADVYTHYTTKGHLGMDRITMAAAEQYYPPQPYTFPQGVSMLMIQAITCTVYVRLGLADAHYWTLAPGQSMGLPMSSMAGNFITVEGSGAGACEFVYDFTTG